MFEKCQKSEPADTSSPKVMPFWPCNANTASRDSIKSIGKYEFSFDQKLGSGLTSDAYIGYHKEQLKLVCIKIIDREVFRNPSQQAMLANEIKCQTELKSDFIVGILDVYDTSSFCFVVTQLCEDGDLFKLITFSKFGLPEPLVVKLSCNIAQALALMKQHQIVHRDIKSENILLKAGVAKLGDFGFAIKESQLKQKQEFNIGSPLYMALETLEHNKYSYESDLFSFGVVMYEMLHAQSPWECSDEKQLIHRIKTEPVVFKSGMSQKLQHIVGTCLQVKPQDRTSIEQILRQLQELELEAAQSVPKIVGLQTEADLAVEVTNENA